MATPYSDIYDRALFKLRDSKLASLNLVDQQYVLKRYLQSALADFEKKCLEYDLGDVDKEGECFNTDLSNEVQEILAAGTAYYWLDAQLMDKDMLRNKMSTKDYTYFSPANLVKETEAMRKERRTEYRHRIVDYTYDHGNLSMSES